MEEIEKKEKDIENLTNERNDLVPNNDFLDWRIKDAFLQMSFGSLTPKRTCIVVDDADRQGRKD